MKCKTCSKYGHTKTRYRRKVVCRNCGGDDPISDKTNPCSNESKSENCGEWYMAGSNDCEMKKKE